MSEGTQTPWKDILAGDLSGRDVRVEQRKDGQLISVFRGPILSIRHTMGMVNFRLFWTGRTSDVTLPAGQADWRDWHFDTFFVSEDHLPTVLPDGSIQFVSANGHVTTILPAGDNLDRTLVLPLSARRSG